LLISEVHDKTELTKQLSQGKIAGIVEEKNEGDHDAVYVTTTSANPLISGPLLSAISGIVDKTNLRLSGVTTTPVVLKQQQMAGREARYIDFALPGQIGFALLSTALFGTVFGLIYLKRAGVLKRMFATPTKPLTILLAQGTSRLIVALI